MKRDELLAILKMLDCPHGHGEDGCSRDHAIAWLERLPEGCELVGIDTDSDPRGRGFVYDTGANRGNGSWVHIMVINPDDLTKAGKSRQFEALECKKCNLDGPDNCWNHKVGKR